MGCSGSCSGGCPSQEQEPRPEVLIDIAIEFRGIEDVYEDVYRNISFESLHISGRMIQFQDGEGLLRAYLLADNDRVVIKSVQPLPR